MSRLSTMSPAVLRAMFGSESDDTLIVLLTITSPGVDPIRVADNWTQRLSEDDEDILYGVRSRGEDYLFLPIEPTLPTEEEAAPRSSITIRDLTQRLIPVFRTISTAPSVLMELVLYSTPDVVEASFPGLLLSNVSYDADSISADLTVESMAIEPFPAHTITPAHFPGSF